MQLVSDSIAKPAKASGKRRAPAAKDTLHLKTKMPEIPGALELGDMTMKIATAAYYLAEQRGFAPGHELDDWLAAEREVLAVRS